MMRSDAGWFDKLFDIGDAGIAKQLSKFRTDLAASRGTNSYGVSEAPGVSAGETPNQENIRKTDAELTARKPN